MNKKPFIFLISVLLGLSFIGCESQPPTTLRLATYTYSTNDRIDNLQPLAEHLEAELARPISVHSYEDVASFLEGIKANEVDIGLINTLGYLLLSLDNTVMTPVANLKVQEDSKDNYKTVLLTNKMSLDNSNIAETLDSLNMLLVAPGSTSGNLVPRLYLSSMGIKSPEIQFKSLRYGGDHTITLQKLVEGETDLCSIGSNEYYKQLKKDSSLSTKTKVLWISEEIPLGPVLVSNSLSSSQKEQITKVFLSLHTNHSVALNGIKAGWSEAKQAEKFHAISDSYYDQFRNLNGNSTDLGKILNQFMTAQ